MRNHNITTMNRPTRGTSAAFVLGTVLLLGNCIAVAQPGDAADQRPVRLWAEAAVQTDVPPMSDAVIRSRSVRVDPAMLADMSQGGRVIFDLFDDLSLVGLVNRRIERTSDRYTLSGRIEGTANGEFILAVNHDVLAGIIRTGVLGTYHIRFGPDGLHVVDQIDASLSFTCTTGEIQFVANQNGIAGGGAAADGACDDGSVIDLLVVYTQEARDEAGGVLAIEAEIDLMVQDNNLAYMNGLVETQMNLVFVWPVYLDESEITLARLTNPDDGYMDDVHTLRNAYGADQVALIRSGGGGVANGLWNLNPESEARAFCINGLASAPIMVLAHEVGHNMGCCHAIGDGGGCPPGGGLLFPFSNGYRFFGDSGTQWRTVMAYSPGNLVAHISNPDVLFDGQPTGVPEGEPDAADNAQTINLSAFTVSNWRCNDGICEGLDLPSDAEDCNENGLPDACEVALGWSLDVNRNGIPDECECLGDLDGSGDVGVKDLLFLLGNWGPCPPKGDCLADLDASGDVGVKDLLVLLGNWGPCP
ncbi:MAG: hypothetical protein IIB53_16345 [Planctomycetes bacterium]|nr:hypothetical protein [Planctomycetota bacterium]